MKAIHRVDVAAERHPHIDLPPGVCPACRQFHPATAACPGDHGQRAAPRSVSRVQRVWPIKTHPQEPKSCVVLDNIQSIYKQVAMVRSQSAAADPAGVSSYHCFRCSGHNATCRHVRATHQLLNGGVEDAAPGAVAPLDERRLADLGSMLPVEGELLAHLLELATVQSRVPLRRSAAIQQKKGAKAEKKRQVAGGTSLNEEVLRTDLCRQFSDEWPLMSTPV